VIIAQSNTKLFCSNIWLEVLYFLVDEIAKLLQHFGFMDKGIDGFVNIVKIVLCSAQSKW